MDRIADDIKQLLAPQSADEEPAELADVVRLHADRDAEVASDVNYDVSAGDTW